MRITLESGFEISFWISNEGIIANIQYQEKGIAQIHEGKGEGIFEIDFFIKPNLFGYPLPPGFMAKFPLSDFLAAVDEATKILKDYLAMKNNTGSYPRNVTWEYQLGIGWGARMPGLDGVHFPNNIPEARYRGNGPPRWTEGSDGTGEWVFLVDTSPSQILSSNYTTIKLESDFEIICWFPSDDKGMVAEIQYQEGRIAQIHEGKSEEQFEIDFFIELANPDFIVIAKFPLRDFLAAVDEATKLLKKYCSAIKDTRNL